MQLEQGRQATRINTCIGALVHIFGCTLSIYQEYTRLPASVLADRPYGVAGFSRTTNTQSSDPSQRNVWTR
jgi:hypothetical protein